MSVWSTRRLGWARDIIKAQRYLEIGVSKGNTFNNFTCAQKDAVDPKFGFDVSGIATESIRFFEQTSDEFFLSPNRDNEPDYDLCFIDGLHTYEQTLRDLMNVLARTNRRSVILIDDTVPNDVFSAQKTPSRVSMHRQRLGIKDNSWHGDAFKVVFFIHDFMPLLSFATIIGSGNPQTLVWWQRRVSFKPLFGDTEKISRMNYFEMFEQQQYMNMTSEEEARELLKDVLGQKH